MPATLAGNASREDLLRDLDARPMADQRWVLEILLNRFASRGFELPSEAEELLERQKTGQAALRKVQKECGLDPRTPVKAPLYRTKFKELGLPSVSAIGRAAAKRRGWGVANQELTGQRVRVDARTRSYERARMGARRKHEDPMTGVRIWQQKLSADGSASEQSGDYSEFVDSYNARQARRRKRNRAKPLISLAALTKTIPAPFDQINQWAHEGLSTQEARDRARELPDAVARSVGPLVAVRDVARLRKVSQTYAQNMTDDEAFPAHAARLGRMRLWMREDVEAWNAGQPVPSRQPEWLGGEVLSTQGLAELRGSTQDGIRQQLSRRKHLVPEPAGYVSGSPWWWREEAERFYEENPPRHRRRAA